MLVLKGDGVYCIAHWFEDKMAHWLRDVMHGRLVVHHILYCRSSCPRFESWGVAGRVSLSFEATKKLKMKFTGRRNMAGTFANEIVNY